MAASGSAPVLLRRPLPPLKKKEDIFSKKSKADPETKKNAKVAERSLEVYNALERKTTRQKTDDLGREADKMKVRLIKDVWMHYDKRLWALLHWYFCYPRAWC